VRLGSAWNTCRLSTISGHLSTEQLAEIWRTYQVIGKPVLIHCSAGIDRIGSAVDFIWPELDR
jgi:protein tyrosine phosphatase